MNERNFLDDDLFLEDSFEPLTVEEEKELVEHLREYRESPFYLDGGLFFLDDEDDLFIL